MKFTLRIKEALKKISGAPQGRPVPAEMEDIARNPADLSAIESFGSGELDAVATLGLYMAELYKNPEPYLVQPELNGLLIELREAQSCLVPYLIAGKEALRLYDAEYIPAAGTPAKGAEHRRDVEKGREALTQRLGMMEDVQEKSGLMLAQLRRVPGAPEETFFDLSGFVTSFREATLAQRAKNAAAERLIAAASAIQRPFEVKAPLKLKTGKKAPAP